MFSEERIKEQIVHLSVHLSLLELLKSAQVEQELKENIMNKNLFCGYFAACFDLPHALSTLLESVLKIQPGLLFGR